MISTEQRLLQQDAATRELQPVRIPVPRVIRGTALIFIGFFVVTASLVLVSRSTGVRFDLLDTYANILPGQPWANAEASGFECGLYNHTDHYECSLRPATDIFSRISVTRYNDAINRVIFTTRENGLALGEVLDGNWYSGMVTDIIRPMAWCGSTTDAIVVGIGYPEGDNPVEAFRESFTRRDADLTPVRDEEVEKSMEKAHKRPSPNGDAASFLKLVKDELIPMVERDYRADPSRRILAGHSYGGLFGIFAMLEAPDLFNTLILGSPTLTYGNRFMFQREEAFAKEHKKLLARVYLYVGELEEGIHDTTVTDTLRLAAILQGRKYEGFSLVKQVFLDQNHCEVAAPGFQWGLKHALKR